MRTLERRPGVITATTEPADPVVPVASIAGRPEPVAGLTVGHADDPAERAADALADTAIERLRRATSTTPTVGVEPVPRPPAPSATPIVGRAGGPLDPGTSTLISARLGGGRPLPGPDRSRMEAAFGTGLSHVRLHDDPMAGRLNDAVAARAFTLGNDVFLGRGVDPTTRDGDQVLAHEIAHVLTERTGLHRLRRWWQPVPPPAPQPLTTLPPRSKKQPDGLRWEEVLKDPRGDVFRLVDGGGHGWEAIGPNAVWKQTDWNIVVDRTATWWYDATAGKWGRGDPPATHRRALDEERPPFAGPDLHGYPDARSVPVYVKAKYRLKPTSKKTRGPRGPGLRALDRTARVLMTDMPEASTPHLATAPIGGSLHVAGNTGNRHVTATDATRGLAALRGALDPGARLPEGRRARKDAIKLRALQSGDYRAHHAASNRGLGELSAALTAPPNWHNVGQSAGDAEHGEMTVLADLDRDLRAHPNPGPNPIVRDLGGVKLACGACKLAFEAYNQLIAAPLGYSIKVSGTHGGFYLGWRAPDVIWNHEAALAYVESNLPEGYLDDRGVLRGISDSSAGYHGPEESDSEWEEV